MSEVLLLLAPAAPRPPLARIVAAQKELRRTRKEVLEKGRKRRRRALFFGRFDVLLERSNSNVFC